MNQNETASSFNAMKTAKFILFKCVPLTVASVFAASAFAEDLGCPTEGYIYDNFETKLHITERTTKDYYYKTSDKSDWVLSYGNRESWKNGSDERYKGTKDHHPLKVVSVQAQTTSKLFQEQHLNRVVCTYAKDGNPNAPAFVQMTMNAYATLYAHYPSRDAVNLYAKVYAGYSSNVGKITINTPGWIKKLGEEFDRICTPSDVIGCNFTFAPNDQPNGYWQDTLYRCWNFSNCTTTRNKLIHNDDSVANRLKGINKATGKRGCTDLTCSAEIKEVNDIIQYSADKMSYGVTAAWWSCWNASPWKKVWTVRLDADKAGADAKRIEVNGTLHWPFKTSEGAYSYDDKTKERGKACNKDSTSGKPDPLHKEMWPKLSEIGYVRL
jgi:hypothetical protein